MRVVHLYQVTVSHRPNQKMYGTTPHQWCSGGGYTTRRAAPAF